MSGDACSRFDNEVTVGCNLEIAPGAPVEDDVRNLMEIMSRIGVHVDAIMSKQRLITESGYQEKERVLSGILDELRSAEQRMHLAVSDDPRVKDLRSSIDECLVASKLAEDACQSYRDSIGESESIHSEWSTTRESMTATILNHKRHIRSLREELRPEDPPAPPIATPASVSESPMCHTELDNIQRAILRLQTQLSHQFIPSTFMSEMILLKRVVGQSQKRMRPEIYQTVMAWLSLSPNSQH
jgi:hypothetical protein